VTIDAEHLLFFNKDTHSWVPVEIAGLTVEDCKLVMQTMQSELFERTHGHHPNVDDMLEDQADLARKGVKEDGT